MGEPVRLPYVEVAKITDNFSKERMIGEGGYGKVYKGTYNNEAIAVKMLHNVLDSQSFEQELGNLWRLRHDNIVQLIAYCDESSREPKKLNGKYVTVEMMHRALCFEYVQNGSLAKYIYDESAELDWLTAYKTIKGTCEGIKYLHEEHKMYHLDLKPENILLDNNMVAKLADFGLSKLIDGKGTIVTQNTMGTLGYMPPEYMKSGQISNKFDIYSLGVVIFKMVAGREIYYNHESMSSEEIIDLTEAKWRRKIQATYSVSVLEEYCKQVKMCTKIALDCVKDDMNQRPNIVDIINKMNEMEIAVGKALNAVLCYGMEKLERLTYEELVKITYDFSEAKTIGHGGFGKVYKGTYNNVAIAVKVLHNHLALDSVLSLEQELCNIWRLRHDNIVRLIAYCDEEHSWSAADILIGVPQRALCSEYMQNGSLQKYLSDECVELDWHTAYKIIKGTCEGIKYLHEECNMLHLDLKPENILLDNNMVAKLADFGLSKLVVDKGTMVTETATGRLGYMPPEYIKGGKYSDKFDIFSLGVVIIEMVAGRETYYNYHYKTTSSEKIIEKAEAKWRSNLQATCSFYVLEEYCEQVKMCTEIALNCVKDNMNERPSIVDTINKMNEMEIALDKICNGIKKLERLTYEELVKITDNFSEKRKIGHGGFGKVYEGTFNNEAIAVKVLHNNQPNDPSFDKEFWNIWMLSHDNIVRLIAYCDESHREPQKFNGKLVSVEVTQRALCFEYMQKGSLEKYMSEEGVDLDWHTAYQIIKGTCEGIKYLQERKVYHLDLKPENILLDNNMVAKLADFGLSKLVDGKGTIVTQNTTGTYGYMPLEFVFGGTVSDKFDIFSLGVVIFEMVAGKKIYSDYYEETMSSEEIIDLAQAKWRNKLQATCTNSSLIEECCKQVKLCTEIALNCVKRNRKQRPSIVDIIDKMNEMEIAVNKAK